MDWSADRIETFRKLWGDGMATRAIAAALGVTKNAVVGKAYRLGFERRRPSVRPGSAPRPVGAERRPATPAKSQHPILSLTPDTCHWPIGDPKLQGFRFCLGATERGRSYCATHAARSSRGSGRIGRNDDRPGAG